MTSLEVEIIPLGCVSRLPHSPLEGELRHAAIVEAGMTSGDPSIRLSITLPDGKRVDAHTSPKLLNGLVAAVEGAKIRWAKSRSKN